MKRIGLGFVLVLTGLISPIGGWKIEEITTFDQGIIAVTIGKGRNDDTNRLYCWVGNMIKELTYSEGGWYITQGCSLSTLGGMVLAKARNDGRVRLYAVSDSTLWEFTFSKGEWKGISFPVIDHSVRLTGLLAGPARNDDTLRLYCGIPDTAIIELTWRKDKWEITGKINTNFSLPTAIGKGRNDGIIRLYSTLGGTSLFSHGMVEWTYTDGEWVKGTSLSLGSIEFWTMGDGRNDSLMRIYGRAIVSVEPPDAQLREFTYSEGEWKFEAMYESAEQVGAFVRIGDGRNQGKNCVYVWWYSGIYEYEWREGAWRRDSIAFALGEKSEDFLSEQERNLYVLMEIGKGRQDDSNRIYCGSGLGGRLFEIIYEPEGITERDYSSHREIWEVSLYPNPFSREIKIEWQGAPKEIPLNLEIYNAIGQRVKSFPQGVKTHSIVWDGKDNKGNLLPSGVYFCRLQTGGKSFMKKVVLKR